MQQDDQTTTAAPDALLEMELSAMLLDLPALSDYDVLSLGYEAFIGAVS